MNFKLLGYKTSPLLVTDWYTHVHNILEFLFNKKLGFIFYI